MGEHMQRLIQATRCSLTGLRQAFKDEAAFRLEVYLAVVLIPLAIWLGSDGVERALLIGSIGLVLVTELLNTGVESAIDRFGPEKHPMSAKAKDVGSAAVFVSIAVAVLVWLVILV